MDIIDCNLIKNDIKINIFGIVKLWLIVAWFFLLLLSIVISSTCISFSAVICISPK